MPFWPFLGGGGWGCKNSEFIEILRFLLKDAILLCPLMNHEWHIISIIMIHHHQLNEHVTISKYEQRMVKQTLSRGEKVVQKCIISFFLTVLNAMQKEQTCTVKHHSQDILHDERRGRRKKKLFYYLAFY
jgi:hypothetical protein